MQQLSPGCSPRRQSIQTHRPFTVTLTQDRSTNVLLCTDDWLEAHAFVRNMTMPTNGLVSIKGVHPTHDFVTAQGEKRCHQCGAYGNGSYGSQAPCGFDFARKPLSHHIEAWIASRPVTSQPEN
jgi:hypothetical protein